MSARSVYRPFRSTSGAMYASVPTCPSTPLQD
jgi:hypothetical protein